MSPKFVPQMFRKRDSFNIMLIFKEKLTVSLINLSYSYWMVSELDLI